MGQRASFVGCRWSGSLLLGVLSVGACAVIHDPSAGPDGDVSDARSDDAQSDVSDASSVPAVVTAEDRGSPLADSSATSDAGPDDVTITADDGSPDESDAVVDRGQPARDSALDEMSNGSARDGGKSWTPLAASCEAIAPPGVQLDAVVDLTIGDGSGGLPCFVGLLHPVVIHQLLCGSISDRAELLYGYFPEPSDPKPGERLLVGLVAQHCRPNQTTFSTSDMFSIRSSWPLVDRDELVSRLTGTGSAEAGSPTSADAAADTPDAEIRASCQCTGLPNVQPGAVVACRNGQCAVAPSDCTPGWGHCSDDPADGCETVLSRPVTCGSCARRCVTPQAVCSAQGDTWACGG